MVTSSVIVGKTDCYTADGGRKRLEETRDFLCDVGDNGSRETVCGGFEMKSDLFTLRVPPF